MAPNVLLADPPWSYIRNRSTDANPYPRMPLEDIYALRPAAAARSVLFLWATLPLAHKAQDTFSAWGFAYKGVFLVWRKRTSRGKTRKGFGSYTYPNCELLLVGSRGCEISAPAFFLDAHTKVHSEKPPVYKLVEAHASFLGELRCRELFAREPKSAGWLPPLDSGPLRSLRLPITASSRTKRRHHKHSQLCVGFPVTFKVLVADLRRHPQLCFGGVCKGTATGALGSHLVVSPTGSDFSGAADALERAAFGYRTIIAIRPSEDGLRAEEFYAVGCYSCSRARRHRKRIREQVMGAGEGIADFLRSMYGSVTTLTEGYIYRERAR